MQIHTIGSALRELREQKGLLLREVGAKLSLDPAILSKIERNERLPTKRQVEVLSNFYTEKKDELVITWLSDKLVYAMSNEDFALQALKLAEQKIKYNKR